MSDPLGFFLVLLQTASLSFGGLNSLPLLRQELVLPGIATDRQLIEAIAIGRISTGPTGLFVVSLGYLLGGWLGGALALAAMTLPPLTLVPAAVGLRERMLAPWFGGVIRGVAVVSAGSLVATGASLFVHGADAGGTTEIWQLAILAAGVALTVRGRLHPAVLMGVAAVLGIALARA